MDEQKEAGFLAAITGAPTDDTTRLVYADWLEEQGDTEMAEFLRLECRMADAYARLQTLRYTLEAPDWVEQVQVRRNIVLHSIPPAPMRHCRPAVIRLLRQYAGLSQEEARALIRELPVTILHNLPIAHAIRVHQEFGQVAMVTLAQATDTPPG